jgi:hypothetical protein
MAGLFFCATNQLTVPTDLGIPQGAYPPSPRPRGESKFVRRMDTPMSRGPHNIRQTDVEKVVRAALKAGLPVARVEVSPEGRIIVIAGLQEQDNPTTENEWDAVT